MAIKKNIACVEIIEAENVPDEAGATTTMENMIQQGAKMIIATAFNHQYPALTLLEEVPGCDLRACRRLGDGRQLRQLLRQAPGCLVPDGRRRRAR